MTEYVVNIQRISFFHELTLSYARYLQGKYHDCHLSRVIARFVAGEIVFSFTDYIIQLHPRATGELYMTV